MSNYKKNRRRFNKEMYNYLKANGKMHTIKEWLLIINEKYNENYTSKELNEYFIKNKIDFKHEREHCSPIGSERIKKGSNGFIQIKVGHNKWEYKQRVIYEQYYGVKLTKDDHIIFLDQDKTNFDINNLIRLNKKENGTLYNHDLFSTNANITKLGIDVANLMIKVKEKQNEIN